MKRLTIHNALLLLAAMLSWPVVPASALEMSGADSLSVNDRRRYDYFYMEGYARQIKGDYVAAYEMFRHAARINPGAAEVYFAQSPYQLSFGNDSLSLALIQKAATLNPANTTYQERLADHYLRNKDYPAAIRAYEQIYERNHTNTDVLELLLQLYQADNQYEEMLRTLDRLETQEGESERITFYKMRVYEMMDDKDSAYGVLRSLVDNHPYETLYRTMLGNWLLQNDREKEAYDCYMQVLKEDPGNVSALTSLYDYYEQTGHPDEALALAKRILGDEKADSDTKVTILRQLISKNMPAEDDSAAGQTKENSLGTDEMLRLFDLALSTPQPNSDVAELRAGYMYVAEMPSDSIDAAFQKVLDIAPDNAGARMHLVQSKWRSQDFDAVLALCLPAFEYHPDEMAFYYYAGMSYYQKDDLDNTLETFRKGVSQINEETDKGLASDFYAIMGDVLYQRGNKQEAYQAYESSLEYSEDNVGTLNNYAYYLSLENRDLHKAEQMSYKTIKAEPKNVTYLDTYAWILFAQERYAEAKIYMDQVMQEADFIGDQDFSALDGPVNAPDSIDMSDTIYDHAGDIYYKNGLVDEAVRFWEKALYMNPSQEVIRWKKDNKRYITEEEYKKRWKKR